MENYKVLEDLEQLDFSPLAIGNDERMQLPGKEKQNLGCDSLVQFNLQPHAKLNWEEAERSCHK